MVTDNLTNEVNGVQMKKWIRVELQAFKEVISYQKQYNLNIHLLYFTRTLSHSAMVAIPAVALSSISPGVISPVGWRHSLSTMLRAGDFFGKSNCVFINCLTIGRVPAVPCLSFSVSVGCFGAGLTTSRTFLIVLGLPGPALPFPILFLGRPCLIIFGLTFTGSLDALWGPVYPLPLAPRTSGCLR